MNMRYLLLAAALLLLPACDGEPDTDDTAGAWWDTGYSEVRSFATIGSEWTRQRTGPGRERHVVRTGARLRPSHKPTAVQVDFVGVGEVWVLLRTGDGWPIASCGGWVDDSALVCMATATPRSYSPRPYVEVWTALDDDSRPTPIGGHIRIEATP